VLVPEKSLKGLDPKFSYPLDSPAPYHHRFFGARRAQKRARRPPKAPGIIQEGLESPNHRPKTPKMSSKRLKQPSIRPKESPKSLPSGPEEAKIIALPKCVQCF